MLEDRDAKTLCGLRSSDAERRTVVFCDDATSNDVMVFIARK
jgi:hypothetical protein